MMFVLYDRERQRLPIRVWLERPDEIEPECLEQAIHLANLPFAVESIALMPDVHTGFGMPIGGILAADDVLVPSAVGMDIGCGMEFVGSNLPVEALRRAHAGSDGGDRRGGGGHPAIQEIVHRIMRAVPLGFEHHKQKQPCRVLDELPLSPEALRFASADRHGLASLAPELEEAYRQVGTLGGGNHFIELQEDEQGRLAIMVHSGSRNLGYKICNYFDRVAQALNQQWKSPVPKEWKLAYLPLSEEAGQAYREWMELALRFARENRERIVAAVKTCVEEVVASSPELQGFPLVWTEEASAHHNYAALEVHGGRRVWVHRKGAILADPGRVGIIPGSMGTASYLVEGLGSPLSFRSASHGAGRRMSRNQAKERLTRDALDRALGDVVLGTTAKGKDILEEAPQAYKDIDYVISQEEDLVRPVKKLRTVAVVKG